MVLWEATPKNYLYTTLKGSMVQLPLVLVYHGPFTHRRLLGVAPRRLLSQLCMYITFETTYNKLHSSLSNVNIMAGQATLPGARYPSHKRTHQNKIRPFLRAEKIHWFPWKKIRQGAKAFSKRRRKTSMSTTSAQRFTGPQARLYLDEKWTEQGAGGPNK